MSVPTQDVLPNWFLDATAQDGQPPDDLGSVASTFLGTLYTDPQWIVVQQELEQLSRDNSIEGILLRQKQALLGVVNVVQRLGSPDLAKITAIQEAREEAQRSLAAEIEAVRARVDEIAEHIRELTRAIEQTRKDSPRAQVAALIARIATKTDLSRIGPYWAAIVLYWLIVHMTMGELAALTLWFMVVSDASKKKD